jgi:hypothetical protein
MNTAFIDSFDFGPGTLLGLHFYLLGLILLERLLRKRNQMCAVCDNTSQCCEPLVILRGYH